MFNMIGAKVSGVFLSVKARLNNEKGAELMEWIGMCLVVLALMGAVITFFNNGSNSIGQQIQTFITDQIDNLSGGGGGG